GTVWAVERSTAPSGVLEDDLEWRSAAGLGLAIGTPLGRFQITYAAHIDGQAFDEEAEINLSFSTDF
ncbi:MAG: BamA/TamA family outer membrane protein, partial [Pseudomonadota bacterium]